MTGSIEAGNPDKPLLGLSQNGLLSVPKRFVGEKFMGWLSAVAGVAAAIAFYLDDNGLLSGLAAVAAVGAFWSHGVMHNFATESAKRRAGYDGGFYDLSSRDLDAVPNWIAGINLVLSLGSFALLIGAGVAYFL